MSMFQLEYYPKISLFLLIANLCQNFSKRRADVVYARLREDEDEPFDFTKWPQHRAGLTPDDIKRENTKNSYVEMWVKDGSIRGYGRKQIFSSDGCGERGNKT